VSELDISEGPVFMLCDYAEVINGKLYIMGGGWDVTRQQPDTPLSMALGVLLRVGWEQTNAKHLIEAKLVTEDGRAVQITEQGPPVIVQGELEVGRPAGMQKGASIPAPLAVRLPALSLDPGSYRFELHVNGSIEGTASFRVVS
jgi:hypothetical protein